MNFNPPDDSWYMDTGASSHLTNNADHAPTKAAPSRPSMASPNDFLTSPSHSPSTITPSREATSQVPNQHRPLQSFGKIYSKRVVPTPSTPTIQPPKSTHTPPPRITTRSHLGIINPNRQFNLNSITTSTPLPRSHIQALKDPNWIAAMQNEINAIHSTGAWKLVPRPPSAHVINSLWLFQLRLAGEGELRFDSQPPQHSHNLMWTLKTINAPKMGAGVPLFDP
ncbi:hypothetical protein AgCh_039514 [Apium graveolens]